MDTPEQNQQTEEANKSWHGAGHKFFNFMARSPFLRARSLRFDVAENEEHATKPMRGNLVALVNGVIAHGFTMIITGTTRKSARQGSQR